MKERIAQVYLLDSLYAIDKGYDYYIPEALWEEVSPGTFVTVPFGGGNRKQIGIVFSLTAQSAFENLKPVLSVIHDRFSLNEELLGLCLYIKEQTFCTIGDAVRTILPTTAFSKLHEYYTAEPLKENQSLNRKSLYVYNYIKTHENVSLARIQTQFGDDSEEVVTALVRSGVLQKDTVYDEVTNDRYTEYLSLAVSEEEVEQYLSGMKKMRSPKQLELLHLIYEGGRLSTKEIYEMIAVNATHVKGLLQKGLIVSEKVDNYRNPYASYENLPPPDENILSEEQQDAANQICTLSRTGKPQAVLLHGITGSGKTRIMKTVIDDVLQREQQVILLIPEISLTPQTVHLFCSYYGNQVAVIHSGLSAGERLDAWKRIKKGEISLVIGTRSAVFAPFENLGLLIIDEEQEHTYKSDMTPKYHTRDVARYRCAKQNALLLLASATPSIESYYKAKSGIYTLIELKERYGEAQLPDVIFADLRIDSQQGNISPIGTVLAQELKENQKHGEQSILFINRRGYNNFLSCRKCGYVATCPHCSVSMTYHTYGSYHEEENRAKQGYLICHYCGYRTSPPLQCPECQSNHLQYMGFGTQRIEDELAIQFPGSTVLRMDTDTTSTKFSYQEMLERFRNQEADILLGTQMVTKGHDFPNVTLVGVLLADASLHVEDYRANERTFSLITQVIGRAGRGTKKGRAIIQTYTPEHETLLLAAKQDYPRFYQSEIALRKALLYPPFCEIALLTLSSEAETELLQSTTFLAQELKRLMETAFRDISLQMFGPFEAPIYKVNEKYRMRILLKCKMNKRTREFFQQILILFTKKFANRIFINLDRNPNSV